MTKLKDNVWSIFFQGVKLYFTNFGSFFKYLAFPVLGQVLGILLAFAASYFYTMNVSRTSSPDALYENFFMIIAFMLLLTLPGFVIFAKAFWEYLVAYGAINSMVDNMLKSGKVYDFPAHTQLITRKTAKYVGLWLVIGLLTTLAIFPLFWVIGGIMFVYFVLVFQVFTFEPDKSILECFQKSVLIVKGKFAKTVLLLILLGVVTYGILPYGIQFLSDFLSLTKLFSIPVEIWARQLQLDSLNTTLASFHMGFKITSVSVANYIVSSTISYVVIGLTLPLRSICCALWYKALNKPESKLDKKILERAELKD